MTKIYDDINNRHIESISFEKIMDLCAPWSFSYGYGNSNLPYITTVSAAGYSSTSVPFIAERAYGMPFFLGKKTHISKIGVYISLADAGSTVRLGLYKDDGLNGFPGSLVLDAGTVDSSSTGYLDISTDLTLQGKFWLLGISSSSVTRSRVHVGVNSVYPRLILSGAVSPTSDASSLYYLYKVTVPEYLTAWPESLADVDFSVAGSGAPFTFYLQV